MISKVTKSLLTNPTPVLSFASSSFTPAKLPDL